MYAGKAISIPSETIFASRRDKLYALSRPIKATDHSKLICTFHAPDALSASVLAQWPVLAEHAAEPNSFLERWFLEPSLALLADPGDIQIAVVESADGMLVGLVPLIVNGRYGRIPMPAVKNWSHSNSFLGVPMMRMGLERNFWITLLTALETVPWARGLLHITGLTQDGPVHMGLQKAARQLDRQCDDVHRIQRAFLQSTLSPDDYWQTGVRAKKRKEIRRLERRLEEIGKVSFARLGPPDDVASWIEKFLALELSGWKGKEGSALASNPDTAELFRTALGTAHDLGKLDFMRLDLDGEPIAMLVNFLAAPGAFGFKTTYDEHYSRYSPGVILQRHNLTILGRPDIRWVDSCASENHPMIDSLWSDTRTIVRVSVSLPGKLNRTMFWAGRSVEKATALYKIIRSKLEKIRD